MKNALVFQYLHEYMISDQWHL